MLELNRDHYLMIGVVLLLLGVQLRYVDTFVLNEKTSEIIAKQFGEKDPAVTSAYFFAVPEPVTAMNRTVRPPPWLGWSLLSVGAVLSLHSLALKKPDG